MKKVFVWGSIAAVTLLTFVSWKGAAELKRVTGIKLNENVKIIRVDEEFTLIPTVEPADAADKTVTWQSSKPDIVSVDANGKVRGIVVGEATIIATTKDGNKTARCQTIVTADKAK